jgi:hypothetical protein
MAEDKFRKGFMLVLTFFGFYLIGAAAMRAF